ncbi:MAG: CoA-binding protein [Promethearchaeota archaeon]
MTKQDKNALNVKNISFINDIKSIAIVGPSKKRDYFFLRNHAESFKGNIYAVHPTLKEIPDFQQENIFPSLMAIPNNVDFAFIAVPPNQILKVIDDCIEKKVKLATVFTSEFSDSGTEEGINLEKEMLNRAKNKVRILGPNGMGLFYPKIGLAWRPKFPTTPGNVGFIAQSGGVCNIAVYSALELGIHFSKVFSFGNGADLDFVDLLYFLSNDTETDIILCYIEGIKEGRSIDLQKVLAQNKKPIVVLKGGRTKTGSIAAKTHTASISGDTRIWEALFRQHNLIVVDTLEQLLFTAHLIDCYGIFDLTNIAVFSISGGYGVIMVDLIEKEGINVPPFSPNIQAQLNERFFMPGTSPKNPLDLAAQFFHVQTVREIIDLALSDNNIDGLIMDLPSFYFSRHFRLKTDLAFVNDMIEILSLGHKYRKPLIPIIQHVNCPEERAQVSKKLIERKIPVFANPLEVIPLLSKITKYKRNLLQNPNFFLKS